MAEHLRRRNGLDARSFLPALSRPIDRMGSMRSTSAESLSRLAAAAHSPRSQARRGNKRSADEAEQSLKNRAVVFAAVRNKRRREEEHNEERQEAAEALSHLGSVCSVSVSSEASI